MFRSLLDDQQVHKELKYATRSEFVARCIFQLFVDLLIVE